MNVLLCMAFVGDIFIQITPDKQPICLIAQHPIAIIGTDHEINVVTCMSNQAKNKFAVKLQNSTVIRPMSQISGKLRALRSGLQMVKTHPHLMKKKLAMVARYICDVISNRPFKVLISVWSKLSMKLLETCYSRDVLCFRIPYYRSHSEPTVLI